MRYTLLEMTQLILSALDSDEVTDINGTVESTQVANLIKSAYYDMAVDMALPEHETVLQLTASGDNAKPCLMTVPDTVTKIRSIFYDYKADADTYSNYQLLKFKPFEEFVLDQQALRNDTTGVGTQVIVHNGQNFNIMFRSNVDPTYYTTADDQQIIFDAYDSAKDTTLEAAKSMCLGVTYPSWTASNSFVPDLDPTQFSLLINKAKVRAFNELKQTENREAISEARRQKIIVQKRKRKTPDQAEVYRVASRFGRR